MHGLVRDALARAAESIVIGDPADEGTDMGPLIAGRETDRGLSWVEDAVGRGAELVTGGVLINEVPTFRADQQPYGGVRASGNTRESPAYAVREMTDLRFVSLLSPL